MNSKLDEAKRRDPSQIDFETPEQFAAHASQLHTCPHGRLLLASCRSGSALASKVAEVYQSQLNQAGSQEELAFLDQIDYQFSDGETCVRLEQDVSGQDAYLFQALQDPSAGRSVDQNIMALLTGLRALREWGANRVTAVLPYLAYARQDKPTQFKREPTSAKLLADLLISAGIDRLITFEPHIAAIHGIFGQIPVNSIRSLQIFEERFARYQADSQVIAVAPDAGASKMIIYFSRALELNSAIASKFRPEPEKAAIAEVIGDFKGKQTALLLDDMIGTGGTIYSLAQKLRADHGIEDLQVAVAHNLCLDEAHQRMNELYQEGLLRRLIVTNSIPQTQAFRTLPCLEIIDLAPIFSRIINRIHYNRPLADLLQTGAA